MWFQRLSDAILTEPHILKKISAVTLTEKKLNKTMYFSGKKTNFYLKVTTGYIESCLTLCSTENEPSNSVAK
jgi:hypothetical protein